MSNPFQTGLGLYEAQLQASKDFNNAVLVALQNITASILQTAKEGINDRISLVQTLAVSTGLPGTVALCQEFQRAYVERLMKFDRELVGAMGELYRSELATCSSYPKDVNKVLSGATHSIESRTGGDRPEGDQLISEFYKALWAGMRAATEEHI